MASLPDAPVPSRLPWRLATDDALARGVKNGSDAAFAVLFARHHAPLVRYCRSVLLDPEDAQDAAQSALMSALRALRADRATPLRLKPWLYRIAHNEALAVARRRPATVDLDAVEQALGAADPGQPREDLRELIGDLQTLPERQRGALLLRELSGLAHEEIGQALGMSAGAARQAVFEARAGLSAVREGRQAACGDVQRALSDGDGRTRRARALRAHLSECAGCSAFAADIDARRRRLGALFPIGGLAAGGLGGGAALGGAGVVGGAVGGAGVLGGAAAKCAVICAAVAVVGGSIATLENTQPRNGHRPLSASAMPTPRLPVTHRHASSHHAAAAAPAPVAVAPAAGATGLVAVAQTRASAPQTSVRRSAQTAAPRTTARPDADRDASAVGSARHAAHVIDRSGHTPVRHATTPATVPAATPVTTTTATATTAPAATPAVPSTAAAQVAARPSFSSRLQAMLSAIRAQVTTQVSAAHDAVEQQIATAMAGGGQ